MNKRAVCDSTPFCHESDAMKMPSAHSLPFHPAHVEGIRFRAEDEADFAGLDRKALVQSWHGGTSVFFHNRLAFIYGTHLDGGVASLWAVTTDVVASCPLLITKTAREVIHRIWKRGAHRIEVYCHTRNIRSRRWLTTCLGFRVEGLMRLSGPNAQDRFLLAMARYITKF